MTTKVRNKVRCDCKECNGKYVEERTRKRHAELESHLATSVSGFVPFLPFSGNNREESANTTLEISHSPIAEGSLRKISLAGQEELNLSDDTYEPVFADFEKYASQKKRRRQDQFRAVIDDQHDIESDQTSNLSSGDESFNEPVDEYESESDISLENMCLSDDNSDDEEILIEEFTAPDLSSDSEPNTTDTNVDYPDSWILIWIFKYQERFRLSEVATNALIKFFWQVLQDADRIRFKDFPPSSYTARNLLKINKRSKNYAVCPSCNKLYNVATIVAVEGFTCNHVEFPNHPMQKKRKSCGTELTERVLLNKNYKIRPKLLFPLPSLKMQIATLYKRPEFEELLRKWTKRSIDNEIMADIYDSKIWKDFPSELA